MVPAISVLAASNAALATTDRSSAPGEEQTDSPQRDTPADESAIGVQTKTESRFDPAQRPQFP
jgi:hypothetical protein